MAPAGTYEADSYFDAKCVFQPDPIGGLGTALSDWYDYDSGTSRIMSQKGSPGAQATRWSRPHQGSDHQLLQRNHQRQLQPHLELSAMKRGAVLLLGAPTFGCGEAKRRSGGRSIESLCCASRSAPPMARAGTETALASLRRSTIHPADTSASTTLRRVKTLSISPMSHPKMAFRTFVAQGRKCR
jgi:hypothetical protein